ncbi:hypothetical protein RPHASCH2410_PD01325 (plasmid) [Rhizobium phaseoli Ch24-10]|nr:hypothetical protein RPHASCH2410_PD01325 [Rhizobium phaseoli Ch24-10]
MSTAIVSFRQFELGQDDVNDASKR